MSPAILLALVVASLAPASLPATDAAPSHTSVDPVQTRTLDPLLTLSAHLESPARVAVTATEVLVTDPHANAIVRFDLSGAYLGTWQEEAGPVGIAAHPDGRVFVSRRDDAKVGVYDASFTLLRFLGDGNPMVNMIKPTDLAVNPDTGRVYVVDSGGDRVYAFEDDEALGLIVGVRGSAASQFKYPSAVAVDTVNDRFLVADQDNFRVQVFDPSGVYLSKFGYRIKYLPDGSTEGWFTRPAGLAIDDAGRIYVSDGLMSTLRVFDTIGQEVEKVAEYGFDAGDLRTPCGIAIDAAGRILVANSNAGGVEVYDAPLWTGLSTGRSYAGTNALTWGCARRVATDRAPFSWAVRRLSVREDVLEIPGFDPPHMLDDVDCSRCHNANGQPGGHVGLVEGQINLCISCHTGGGQALTTPFWSACAADPYATNPAADDGRGSSHAWGVPALNAEADSVGPAPGGELELHLDGGNIKCSTCHEQHNNNAGIPFLRMNNEGDALCKECHAPRNKGLGEGCSHPVGFAYPSGLGEFPDASSDGLPPLKDGRVECLTCHRPHEADSGGANDGQGDGMLLRCVNDETLCQACHTEHAIHTPGGAWQPTCTTCHDRHDPDNINRTLIAATVTNETLAEEKLVVFLAREGPDSFDDGDPAENNGICQVCHTATAYHRYDGTGLAHFDGQCCTDCHLHRTGFMMGSCIGCHSGPQDNGDGMPPGGRPAVVNGDGTGGHDLGGGVLSDEDCRTCHEMSEHMHGVVRLWDDPAAPSVPLVLTGNPAELPPFCGACHDGGGAPTIHTVGGGWEPVCTECHAIHDPANVNLSLVRDLVHNQTLGTDLAVVFTARTGPDGFGDSGPVDDGICQVCHSATSYHLYDGSGAGHYNGADCTQCHTHDAGFQPTGGACDACHGQPPDGSAFPNTAGAHATHMIDTNGPQIADCYVCHAGLVEGHHINGTVSFASGTDTNADGDIDLAETDVCDGCHSPDGPFDGVAEARGNWAAGLPVSCESCHDTGTSMIGGVPAPPVAGDNVASGFYATGHGRTGAVACTDCHDPTAPHFDGEARTYSWSSAHYGPSQSGVAYAAGYRLKYVGGEVPLMIPANYNITFGYNAALMEQTAFRLCFECHDAGQVLDNTPGNGLDTNFKASAPNPPRNYSYAWGSGADTNEHVAHILNYVMPAWDSDWDTDSVGPGGQNGRDSLTACSSCHNVHGAAGNCGSTNEAMIRDGVLAGRPGGYGFSYVVEDPGSGYPWVSSAGATQATSVGAIFRLNTQDTDMCGGGMCHGNPAPPDDCTYNANGYSWGTYLEYYRPAE